MAKIETKGGLVRGTNYVYHVVDFEGNDIEIDVTNNEISSTTTDFTASTTTNGVTSRAVEVGDIVKLSHTSTAVNEGITAEVTAVAANALTVTNWSAGAVDELAGADISLTAEKKTFQFIEAGGLSFVDGVSGIVWASVTVDDWDTQDFDRYSRIFTSIEPRAKSIAALNGWEPHDNDTLKAIRDTALEIRPDATSTATQVYGLFRSGELHAPTDQMYIWPDTQAAMDAPIQAVTTGYINELVLLQDTVNAIDDRGVWNFRCLEPGKTHLQGTIDAQYAEIYPVAANNGIDPKLADGAGVQYVSDATVSAGGIYANVLINVDVDEMYDGDVDGINYTFYGFVDADSQTNQSVHTKVHYLLRQAADVNSDGTGPQLRGDKQPPITSFLGEQMTVDDYYLLNYDASTRNDLRLLDSAGNERVWPSILTITVTAAALAQGGTFSLMHKDTFGTSNVVYLQDESAVDQRDITISASHSIVVAYSTYSVDGHTQNTPIELVLSWNRPGFIEPDHNENVVLSGSDISVPVSITPDPSYVA